MGFHRLTVPSYFGGLPGGYDYVNNAISGTPALADGAKSGGPNAGTYFVAFGEDATSSDANRANKALAQNTDFLDDTLHRDIALPVRTSDATGAPTTTLLITGPGVFMGLVGAALTDLFHVTDTNDEDLDVGGVKVVVTAASDSGGVLVGGGFSLGNVTITFTPAIGSGVNYRVYYAERTNFANFPADGLTNTRIRNLTEVDYQVEELFRLLHGGGQAWNAAWDSTVHDMNNAIIALQTRATTDEGLIAANTLEFTQNAFQNFIEPGATLGSITTTGNQVTAIIAANWAVEKRLLAVNNESHTYASYDGGYTWAAESTRAGVTGVDFATFGQTSGLFVGSNAGVGSCYAYGSSNNAGSGPNALSASGTPTVTAVRADPLLTDTFWAVGQDSTGPLGSVWKVVTVNGVSPVTQTQVPASGTGSSGSITLVAPGRTSVLSGNATNLFSCSSSSPAFALSQTSPTATAIKELFWSDAQGWFVLIASSGAGSFEVWTSTTGATGTWTQHLQTALVTASYGTSLSGAGMVYNNLGSGANAQSIIMMPLHLSSGAVWDIAVSYDGGVTWKIVADPLSRHQGVSPVPKVQRIMQVNNRLVAAGYQAAGAVFHALSARVGSL